ncbi:hypothetical protein [Streptomyces flavofungini]|uniref:hypothetical protein n=1 Tax=Streptomyces flavofungini TaxID=68200 RepID=UPI0034DF98D8
MSTSFIERLSSADRAAASELAKRRRAMTPVSVLISQQFGDPLARALHRETVYAVPDDQRETCPRHMEWRRTCLHLHLHGDAKAAA